MEAVASPLIMREVSMYQGMTVKQLRAECKARGLYSYSRLKKADLVSVLEADSKFSYDGPCHTQAGPGGEEIKPHGGDRLSPKEIWQARQVDDQDRGGIPHLPKEVPMETTYKVTGVGYNSGPFEFEFIDPQKATDFARACVKEAVSPKYASTVKLTRIIKALEQGEDVTVAPSGQVTVSRHGGRVYAPPGYLIRGHRAGLVTNIGRTCNEQAWKEAGWALSLAAA